MLLFWLLTFKIFQSSGGAPADSSQLSKLKRVVIAAGMRFNYKKLFDGIEGSDKKKRIALKNALEERGFSGRVNSFKSLT